MSEEKEQQTEKKKAGIVKRALKWLGLGLIIFLLIVSIIFQAPWKVITLFAVIFLACTILPKSFRKYFWLCVGGVVVALIIWVFLPEETEGWQPYIFDKELAELQAKYAIPDSENAAIIYNQLLEDYNKATFEPNFVDPNLEDLIRKEPWSSKDYPEAAQWIQQHKDTIAKLIEASKIEECRFPITTNVMFGDIIDRLGPMKKWAQLLISAGNNDIAEGRTKEGLEKYIAVLQMGKHQCQQSTMIDLLVGIAIEALPTNNLKRFIVTGNATEEHLNVIEQVIAGIKHDWGYDLPRILDYEKLLAKNFCGMFCAVNAEGKIRLKPGVAKKAMMTQLPKEMKDEFVTTYWRERVMKASTIFLWFYMPSTPQKAGEVIGECYEKFYAMANPNFDWQKEVGKPAKMLQLNYRHLVERMTEIIGPAYDGVHDAYLRAISQQRDALLTIALRRYKNKTGHWPGSLDEVKSLAAEEIFVDPLNGGSFVYKLTDGNFELYSKGKNNIDENGKYKDGADDWPIWPSMGTKRKTGEEGIK
jgi:hypothetical protein